MFALRASAPAVTPEQLADLLRLVRIGHVRGIEAKLAEMEAGSGAPTAFIAQMRGLTATFDLRRARAVIEGLMEPASDG